MPHLFVSCVLLSLFAAMGCDSNGSAGSGGGSTTSNTSSATPVDPLSWSVLTAGEFTCGHRIVNITYSSKGGLPSRTIPLHIFYPSVETEGEHPKYAGIFVDQVALDDIALAPSPWEKGFPMLVHSHGYKGFAGNSARLMCHFASHGWVALAPEHKGNTIGDTPDPLPLSVYLERITDVSAALDFAEKPMEGDALQNNVDMSRVAMSGHSFGTYTAWAVGGATFDKATITAKCDAGDVADCTAEQIAVFESGLSEPRAKVVIPMAGGHNDFFGQSGYDAAKVPVLLMSGTLDKVGADALFAEVAGVDLTWIEVEGGCHQLFGLGNSVLGDAECAGLPDEEGFGIVNPWVLAYARYHVLSDASEEVTGIVEGKTSVSDRVAWQHKAP